MSQWIPTHVQCTILRARDVRIKGKGGQNEAFVTIQLNKEKFQTSPVKSGATVEWNEECDLPLAHSNDWLILTVCHKNFFGVDEFLGRSELPLNEFDWNERPRARWFALRAKQGKKHENKEHKLRGEVQIMLKFYAQNLTGSTMDLNAAFKQQKHSSLVGTLKHTIGASLRNLHKPGKNDGSGDPTPLSRFNPNNSKSNLSLAQTFSNSKGDSSSGGFGARSGVGVGVGSNLVSQTLPRNLGKFNTTTAASSSGIFDSPRSSNSGGGGENFTVGLAGRTRTPSTASQSVALAALDKTSPRVGQKNTTTMPSPTSSRPALNTTTFSNNNINNATSTSPTSLVDASFRESVQNVNNMADTSSRFTSSPVVAAPATLRGGKKAPAPQPPPPTQSVAPVAASRRVPKVHKLAGGGGGGGGNSVVGNLLSSSTPQPSALNPFEEAGENSPQQQQQQQFGAANRTNRNRLSGASSTFYSNNGAADVTDSRTSGGGGRPTYTSYSTNDDSYNNNDSQNPFVDNGGARNGGAGAAAAAILNRSISNRSSLVSEHSPTSAKGTSLERNQQPPPSSNSHFFAVNNNNNMSNGGGRNGYVNGYGNGGNKASLPVSNLARVEATINSALKPLTHSSMKVPRDLEMKYGHLERNDLLLRLAQLENDLESKDIEIDRMKSYLESLLSRVMEKCPELLHSSSPE